MATELLEWRGVHGHSASVELADEWPGAFAVDHRGWGTDVILDPTTAPDEPRGAPFVWVHLAIASPLQASSGLLVERLGWPEVDGVTAFFQTGHDAYLAELHVWDGAHRLLVDTRHVEGDFRTEATLRNTWAVNAPLHVGLGLSLRFFFNTGFEAHPDQLWIKVAGARARFMFRRREPWLTLASAFTRLRP